VTACSATKLKAELRRFKVVPLLRRGYRSKEIAQELGVSPSTIRRDVVALLGAGVIAVVPTNLGIIPFPPVGNEADLTQWCESVEALHAWCIREPPRRM
jgi:hypothetical protein